MGRLRAGPRPCRLRGPDRRWCTRPQAGRACGCQNRPSRSRSASASRSGGRRAAASSIWRWMASFLSMASSRSAARLARSPECELPAALQRENPRLGDADLRLSFITKVALSALRKAASLGITRMAIVDGEGPCARGLNPSREADPSRSSLKLQLQTVQFVGIRSGGMRSWDI